eukprot:4841893-Prymnesium_polylepis.1
MRHALVVHCALCVRPRGAGHVGRAGPACWPSSRVHAGRGGRRVCTRAAAGASGARAPPEDVSPLPTRARTKLKPQGAHGTAKK